MNGHGRQVIIAFRTKAEYIYMCCLNPNKGLYTHTVKNAPSLLFSENIDVLNC